MRFSSLLKQIHSMLWFALTLHFVACRAVTVDEHFANMIQSAAYEVPRSASGAGQAGINQPTYGVSDGPCVIFSVSAKFLRRYYAYFAHCCVWWSSPSYARSRQVYIGTLQVGLTWSAVLLKLKALIDHLVAGALKMNPEVYTYLGWILAMRLVSLWRHGWLWWSLEDDA